MRDESAVNNLRVLPASTSEELRVQHRGRYTPPGGYVFGPYEDRPLEVTCPGAGRHELDVSSVTITDPVYHKEDRGGMPFDLRALGTCKRCGQQTWLAFERKTY